MKLWVVYFPVIAQLAKDLLHPSVDFERRQHKKKRLVQSANSYFMDVKCPGRDLVEQQTDFTVTHLAFHNSKILETVLPVFIDFFSP